MLKIKKMLLILLMGTMIIQTVACSSLVEKNAEESNAEQTLQAIYVDFTAQAEVETAETVVAAEKEAVEEMPTTIPTQSPPQPTRLPLLIPGEPPDPIRSLKDANSSYKAHENRAVLGDYILDSVYERPFTALEMVYQPDLDIITVDFSHDENFFYFSINLYGQNPEDWKLAGMYGIEFDRTITGRGDLLVWIEHPQQNWTTEFVSIYADKNGDVGGPRPLIANVDFVGNGYETKVVPEHDKVAFARLSPNNPNSVQIAVSRNLLENPKEFLWGAWADNGLKDVTKFDYNDTMGPTRAGSPMKDEHYPLNELYNLDNTCRLPYGFEQVGDYIRGMCIS